MFFLAFVLFFVSVVVEDMCVKIFKESHTYQAAFFSFFCENFFMQFFNSFLVSAFQRKSTRAVWGFGCRESVMRVNEKFVNESDFQDNWKKIMSNSF
jgi:hypothetical protein